MEKRKCVILHCKVIILVHKGGGTTEHFFRFNVQSSEGLGFQLFSVPHICWLIIAAASCVALCLIYRRKDEVSRRRLELCVAGLILFSELVKKLSLIIAGEYSVYDLPLHLCGMAVFISLVHAARGWKFTGELLYSACMPGAAFALIFPDWVRYPVFNFLSMNSFFVHILLTAYPLMLFFGGEIRPEAKRLPYCFLFLAVVSAPVYVFNKLVDANFLFLNWPSPGSPLEWFERWLGNPGYILGYIPMMVLVWTALYLPVELRRRHKS